MHWLVPAIPVVVLLTLVVYVISNKPRTNHLVLGSWPSTPWLGAQIVLSLGGKKVVHQAKESAHLLHTVEVSLSRPVQFDSLKLRKFMKLVGLEEGTAGDVPLMYPVVESFRLCIQAMLLPAFPFPILGAVLARNTCTMHRPIAADERLLYRCVIEPTHIRTTAKGDHEVDILLTAASTTDDKLVWENTVTVIILSKNRVKSTAPASDKPPELSKRTVISTWHLAADSGRRYGSLNGDLNPIHLHPLTSKLFGFKKPIAHALYLVARAEASLRNKGVQPIFPAVFATEFKRPTLLPAILQCAVSPAADYAATIQKEGLDFAILTQDGTKEVLVGKLSKAK